MWSKKGYTAIEMLTVLAVVGITATFALVNHAAQKPHTNLRENGREMVSQLRHLRQQAITTGVTTTLEFLPRYGLYMLSDEEERALLPHVRFGYPSEVDQTPGGDPLSAQAADGVSFLNEVAGFQADGTPSRQGTVYLTNASADDKTHEGYREALAISVNATGRVKLYQWRGTRWE